MPFAFPEPQEASETETPRCPVFGVCGGCAYQHLTYPAELKVKFQLLEKTLLSRLSLDGVTVEPVVGSPSVYHSRSRLDLTLLRRRDKSLSVGFMPPDSKNLLEIDNCVIAREEIASFIPELKKQAAQQIPDDYRTANLVVKTGGDGRVLWGGIGKRSLEMKPEDYFWTELRGRKIYYSLDTFFQANLSILPLLMDKIESLVPAHARGLFLDLYSGVGLFGVALADLFEKIVMIEESPSSVQMAYYNRAAHDLNHVRVLEGRVEDVLPATLSKTSCAEAPVAMIDPPRKGLSESAAQTLSEAKRLEMLFYLSCHPESLARDLEFLITRGWKLERIIPFDFFPRTSHLETLALLRPAGK